MKKTKNIQKIKYEVDDFNRLIVSKPYTYNSPLRKKKIVEGYFKVDKNKLSYYISSLDKELENEISYHKIIFEGKYFLTKDYNLGFTLDKSQTQFLGDALTLKGEILKVNSKGLTFRLRKRTTSSKRRIKDIQLSGFWQADKNNCLIFNIKRQKEVGSYLGKLIFEGIWQVNKQNELIYRYEEETLKTKIKKIKILTFKGYWQIGKSHLTYRLKGYKKSFFNFKVSLKTPTLRASEDKIRYEVGIEYETKQNIRKRVVKKITFFGKWRIRKDLSLAFELRSNNGRYQALVFKGSYHFNKDNEITLKIKNRLKKKPDFEILFSKKFLKDKELFIRLVREKEEKKIEAAIKIPF